MSRPVDENRAKAEAAALMALVQRGVRSDTLCMLTTGDERGTIAPGALRAMVEAVRVAVLESLLEPDERVVDAMFKRWRSGPDYTVRDAQRSCFTAAIRSLLEEK